jgi:WS/DGAT/MGAT family acyltransferase
LRRLRRQTEHRLQAFPRYRCRLSEPHTGGLHWPEWVEDPDFRVEQHVRQAALPAPGGEAELLGWAADYWSSRLDRQRPLWEAVLLTGLEGGRWAIVTKTHHALVDGVGSVDVANLLLDSTRTPRRVALASDAGEPEGASPHGPFGLVAAAARGGLYTARHPGRLRDAFLQSKAVAELVLREEVVGAPDCSLNVPIGGRRRFRVVRTDLDEVKAIKGALGGTVNDVVLAVVTGGLRSMLLARGDALPTEGLRAMVPVNLRSDAEAPGVGNVVSSLYVHLPVVEPDAGHRYLMTVAGTEELKRGDQAAGGVGLNALVGLAPPVLHSILARSAFATRLFNVTVTNVPGPQQPLYAFGARMEEVLPLVPLAADHSVGIAAVSYDGKVFFGLNGDERGAPDLDVLAAGIESALAELRDLAETGHALPTLG